MKEKNGISIFRAVSLRPWSNALKHNSSDGRLDPGQGLKIKTEFVNFGNGYLSSLQQQNK